MHTIGQNGHGNGIFGTQISIARDPVQTLATRSIAAGVSPELMSGSVGMGSAGAIAQAPPIQ